LSIRTPGRCAPLPAERRIASGFTLIELMIVVAIIAILAAIAYPAYTGSIIKGRRAEGRTAIADLLQQQERYMTQNNSYLAFAQGATGTTGTNAAGSTTVNVPFKTFSASNSSNSAYDLGARQCQTGGSPLPTLQQCVEVFAVPRFSDAAAGTLWSRSTGDKGCTGTPSVCWK